MFGVMIRGIGTPGGGEVGAVASPPPRLDEAPLVLRRDPGGVAQQPLDLAPDRLIQLVGAELCQATG